MKRFEIGDFLARNVASEKEQLVVLKSLRDRHGRFYGNQKALNTRRIRKIVRAELIEAIRSGYNVQS
jgi:hypothetical protein